MDIFVADKLKAALQWIDRIPEGAELPAMPGFDRDWVDGLLSDGAQSGELEVALSYAEEYILAVPESIKAEMAAQTVSDSQIPVTDASKAPIDQLKAALAWIDQVPADVELPAMPGFDRDWVESLLAKQGSEPEVVQALGYAIEWIRAVPASIRATLPTPALSA